MSFDIDDCDGPTKKDLLSIYQCAKCSGRVRKEDYKNNQDTHSKKWVNIVSYRARRSWYSTD